MWIKFLNREDRAHLKNVFICYKHFSEHVLFKTLRVPTHQKTYSEKERKIDFIYMDLYGSAHTDSERASKKERLKIVWRWKACSRWFPSRDLKMEALSIVLSPCVSECCHSCDICYTISIFWCAVVLSLHLAIFLAISVSVFWCVGTFRV